MPCHTVTATVAMTTIITGTTIATEHNPLHPETDKPRNDTTIAGNQHGRGFGSVVVETRHALSNRIATGGNLPQV